MIPTNSFRLSNIQNTLHIKNLNAGEWRFHYTGSLSFHTREGEGESTNIYSMFIFAAHFDVGRAKDINNGGGAESRVV